MRNLKNESGCRLQMSKNQEVYHGQYYALADDIVEINTQLATVDFTYKISGTNERICLVKGKITSVMRVAGVVMEKIREKVDSSTPSDVYDHKGVERSKEVRFKYIVVCIHPFHVFINYTRFSPNFSFDLPFLQLSNHGYQGFQIYLFLILNFENNQNNFISS